MRLLRTNNDFKFRVLIYHGFTVLSMFFLKIVVCLKPFCSNFNMILSLFCRKGVQNYNAEGCGDLV